MKHLLLMSLLTFLSFTGFSMNLSDPDKKIFKIYSFKAGEVEYKSVEKGGRLFVGGTYLVKIDGEYIALDVSSMPNSDFEKLEEISKKTDLDTPVYFNESLGIVSKKSGFTPYPSSTKRKVFKVVTEDRNATLHLCKDSDLACADHVTIGGQKVLLDKDSLNDFSRKAIRTLRKKYPEGGDFDFYVRGYFAFENGHRPNHDSYFRVFKSIDFLPVNVHGSYILDMDKVEVNQSRIPKAKVVGEEGRWDVPIRAK